MNEDEDVTSTGSQAEEGVGNVAADSEVLPPPLPEQNLPVPRWRWWIHLLLIGTYPFLGIIFRFSSGQQTSFLTDNPRDLLIRCGIEIIAFSVVFFLGWFASRASKEQLLLNWRPGWWVVPLGALYSVSIRLAMGLVVLVIVTCLVATRMVTPQDLEQFATEHRPNVEAIVDVPAMQNDSSYFWLTLTLVSFVIAGLREELWRSSTLAALGVLWPRAFGSRIGQFAAVTLIAILFGTMHWSMGLLAMIFAGIIGWLLGLIMIFHRSIWPAVIAHGFFDATTFAALPWVMQKIQHLN